MFCFGATILAIGTISTLAQPRLRDINITLLSVGGACTFTTLFVKSFDWVAETRAEIAPVKQDIQEIVEAKVTRATIINKTNTIYIERRIVRLVRTIRR
jgi:hypothetical protein